MNKRIEVLRILNNIVIVFCLYTVGIIMLGGRMTQDIILGSLGLFLFVLFSEIIQYYVRNFILYVTCHLGTAFICNELSIRLSVNKMQNQYVVFVSIFRLVMMIIMIFIAVYVRIRETSVFYPAISEAAFFIGLMIFCYIAERKDGVVFVLLGEMIWAVLVVLFYNARQILSAISPFKNNASVPYDAVKRNNAKMLGLSVAIVIMGMFICSLFNYGKEILNAVHYVIFHFFRWLFGLFDFKEEPVYEPIQEASYGEKMESFLPEDYVDNSIWHTIWQILFWIIAAAVTVVIVVVLVKAFRKFYKVFNGSKIGIKDRIMKDKIEYLNPLRSEEKTTGSLGKNVGLRERFTNEGKVRIIFKKLIQKGNGYKEISLSQTPSELEKTSLGRISKAYMIYEKARYSGHQIKNEEVKEMKEVSRGS